MCIRDRLLIVFLEEVDVLSTFSVLFSVVASGSVFSVFLQEINAVNINAEKINFFINFKYVILLLTRFFLFLLKSKCKEFQFYVLK